MKLFCVNMNIRQNVIFTRRNAFQTTISDKIKKYTFKLSKLLIVNFYYFCFNILKSSIKRFEKREAFNFKKKIK